MTRACPRGDRPELLDKHLSRVYSQRMNTSQLHAEAREYYALVAQARAAGIVVGLDDPNSPRTVAELRAAVKAS